MLSVAVIKLPPKLVALNMVSNSIIDTTKTADALLEPTFYMADSWHHGVSHHTADTSLGYKKRLAPPVLELAMPQKSAYRGLLQSREGRRYGSELSLMGGQSKPRAKKTGAKIAPEYGQGKGLISAVVLLGYLNAIEHANRAVAQRAHLVLAGVYGCNETG